MGHAVLINKLKKKKPPLSPRKHDLVQHKDYSDDTNIRIWTTDIASHIYSRPENWIAGFHYAAIPIWEDC